MSLLRFPFAAFTGRSLAGLLAAGVASLLLAACGGGGGSAGTPPFGGGGTTATVARLSLALTDSTGAPASILKNNGTTRLTATVTALDANNTVVSGATISFAASNGAEIIASGTTTDATGKLVATIGTGQDRSTRSVTVTATATGTSGATASTAFNINGTTVTVSAPPVVLPSGRVDVGVEVVDASANPMIAQKVTLTADGVAAGEANTDGSGRVTFALTAPVSNGGLNLVATSAGESVSKVVQVQSSAVPAAIGTITGVAVAANPSVVSTNPTGTANTTTLRAQFRGAGNVPIQNVRVWFTLPDPNSVGGVMSNGTDVVYSDSTGTATATYVPGAISSPTDGVVVLACYSNVDFDPGVAGVCPATARDGLTAVQSKTATLTVVDQALRLDIGTDELIGLGTGLTYTKDYVIVVVDAAGRAKADVDITPKLDLTAFYKGYYGWNGEAWVRAAPFGVLQFPGCRNEDLDRNGFLSAGEDTNGNGNLDPGGVSITMLGASKTDAAGKATVRIEYPRDRATWIDFTITVTGRVGGSEGVAVYQGNLAGLGNLPAPGEIFRSETITPAFVVSRYGRAPGCDNTN